MARGLKRFGQKEKRRSKASRESRSSDENIEESLRSRSLASYIDLREKARYDEKKKLERLKRKKEKMKEREKKLQRAQKRAAIEIAKSTKVLGIETEDEKAKKAGGESIFKTNPLMGGAFVAVYALILIITTFTVRSNLNAYKLELQKKSKLKEDEASQVIDTAESATVPIIAVSFALMAIGGGFAYFGMKDKKPPFSPTILLGLFIFVNVFIAFYAGINIAGADYFSEIDNTASYILLSVTAIVSLGAGAYLLQTMGGSSSSSSGSRRSSSSRR